MFSAPITDISMIDNSDNASDRRYDVLCSALWDSKEAPGPVTIMQGLRDADDSIRAEILDWLILRGTQQVDLKAEIARMLNEENSFICLCRLVVLASLWKIPDSSIVNVVEPSLFDLKCLQVWMNFMDYVDEKSETALKRLTEYAHSADSEISELAQNLISNFRDYGDRLR
jgi:hypothetical protein